MSNLNWKSDYEAAFLAANGRPCEVREDRAETFRIYIDGEWGGRRYDRFKIMRLTENLRRRVAEREEQK